MYVYHAYVCNLSFPVFVADEMPAEIGGVVPPVLSALDPHGFQFTWKCMGFIQLITHDWCLFV